MRRREIIGTDVAITDYEEVLAAVDSAVSDRRRIYVCCAPASTLVFALKDERLREALAGAEIVTPDGMGVVHAARLLGEQLSDRVYGPDLMLAQCRRAELSGQRVWLYGGFDDATLSQLRSALIVRFPALNIVGWYSPPHRPLTAAENAELIDRINDDAPDIVWVGLGSPKQEVWMHSMRGSIAAPVMCGVGAAFDFISGRAGQAPGWMQRASLEWLYRMLREPRRLVSRYLSTLPRFLALVLAQKLRGARAAD